MNRINFVSFDVRGTLLTVARSVGDIYADAAKSCGIEMDPKVINENFKENFVKMDSMHPNFGFYSGLGWRTWWRNVLLPSFDYQHLVEKNKSEQCETLSTLCDLLIDRFATKEVWKTVAGLEKLLEHLKLKGVPMGIISNFDPRLHRILEEVGIRRYFRFVVTSYEAGCSKPDKNIFKIAENAFALEGYKFSSCCAMHVGDSYENDYCGAINAGWNAALIDPFPEKNNYCDALVFKNMFELKDHFQKFDLKKK